MIILDNSVISAFCEIGRFELLREILYKLNLQAIIPTTVLKEIIFDDALLAITTGKTYSDKWIRVVPVNNYAAYLQSLHPGDKYEQESDRVADAVMRMPEPGVQRQVEPEEEEETL